VLDSPWRACSRAGAVTNEVHPHAPSTHTCPPHAHAGGERSFTTVAFILALGEWTESPFRALDEFDVFMDAVNRRIATQTLLEFAREKAELQFVLLTPQVRWSYCWAV
jgi:hypothetical protein